MGKRLILLLFLILTSNKVFSQDKIGPWDISKKTKVTITSKKTASSSRAKSEAKTKPTSAKNILKRNNTKEVASQKTSTSNGKSYMHDGKYSYPLPGRPIVTQTEARHSRKYRSPTATAIDLRATVGTPVKSPSEGYVKQLHLNRKKSCGYGITLRIGGKDWLFCHFSRFTKPRLKKGERVVEGQIIGYSGATGSRVTGPHLHIEVKVPTKKGIRWEKVSDQKFDKPIPKSGGKNNSRKRTKKKI